MAINLAKGGVNASLIQRIGRILRNPTGDKQAHFYQIVTVPASSQARLPGEDGRRLLRRASEFRALGSRFREYPGFVVTDEGTSEIIHELETAGTNAKIKDKRKTDEIVDDEVASDLLDEITAEIDGTNIDHISQPVLTTHWHPESLAPGTMPVQESVGEPDDIDDDTVSEQSSTVELTDSQLAVKVTDSKGTPIENATVVLEGSEVIDERVTDSDGVATISVETADENGPLDVLATRAGFENHTVFIPSVDHGQTVEIKLQRRQFESATELFTETTPDNRDESDADTPDAAPTNEQERAEIQQVRNELTGKSKPKKPSASDGKADSKSNQSSDSDDSAPSRQELITELHRIDELTDGYPLTTELNNNSEFTPHQYYQEFGSWENALEAAGINKEQRLIEDVRNVAEVVGERPTTTQMNELGIHSSGIIITHFDSWDVAIEVAGVGDTGTKNHNKASEQTQTTAQSAETETQPEIASSTQNEASSPDEGPKPGELIDELQRLDEKTDGYPKTTQVRSQGKYNPEQYYAEFGSWDDALRAAGIDKGQRLIDELLRVAKIVGDVPTTTDMNEHGAVSATLHSSHFGSWPDALDAAEEQRDLKNIIDDSSSESADESTRDTTASAGTSAAETNSSESSSDLVGSLMKDLEDEL